MRSLIGKAFSGNNDEADCAELPDRCLTGSRFADNEPGFDGERPREASASRGRYILKSGSLREPA